MNFPNPSRSYDEAKRGVRFWGYDRTFEISFLVDYSALSKVSPGATADEPGLLNAFDSNLERIRAVAGGVYSRRRKAAHVFSYVLRDADF